MLRPNRSLWGLAMIALLWGGPSAEAQVCDPATTFGLCSDVAVDIPLPLPFSVTVIGTTGEVLVADLSGETALYDQSDLTAPPVLGMNPLGAIPTFGVATHPNGDLFWLVEDAIGYQLVRSDLNGTVLSTVPVVGPTTPLASLTWNFDTGSLWTLAYTEDQILELGLDGIATGAVVTPFSMAPHAGEAYGLGLTAVPSPGIEPLFDVVSGVPSALRADRVDRITALGEQFGLGYSLGAENLATGWMTDIAWSATGSLGVPSTYAVDLTSARLIELPTPAIAPAISYWFQSTPISV